MVSMFQWMVSFALSILCTCCAEAAEFMYPKDFQSHLAEMVYAVCTRNAIANGQNYEVADYETNYPPSCNRPIFCESDLLHDVALSEIDKDLSTPFLRRKLRYPPDVILDRYQALKESYGGRPMSRPELLQFVNETTEEAHELIEWVPDEYKEETALMRRIKSPEYQQFQRKLQEIWKLLLRKVSPDVAVNEDRYSIIYIPNGFTIAGGHFNELYYWDTFWIINGLLLSEMPATVKGIIENFLSLVVRFKFIPNGTRVYYLNRSQPPLLIPMMSSYLHFTNDFYFVRANLQILTGEFEWWMENRSVQFTKGDKTHVMFRYDARSRGPRPESYKNDWEIGHRIKSKTGQDRFYSDIKSAAESGWDFSTRWFYNKYDNHKATLADIHTRDKVPVDLNAILERNARLLSEWWYRSGDVYKGKHYKLVAERLLESIHEVFWREDLGSWFDWQLNAHKHDEAFYGSNFAPLWTQSYFMPKEFVAEKTIQYLKYAKVLCDNGTPRYIGTPTSLTESGQQWDFPNSWAPLQMFLIQGLDLTGVLKAQQLAEKLAQNWVYTNYRGLVTSGFMYEKYDSTKVGLTGGGGEYAPQTGFGWTNGAITILMNRYGDILSPKRSETC
ncbi:unnamed protein product [Bemisia tabaci]|uniref:Trehalase n=1 Tax=Bemisia tabaci TaxID=7038 RepID=A0A9P0AKL5_BEMTA|nr:unnamed protein product [Bemisia tabaci]